MGRSRDERRVALAAAAWTVAVAAALLVPVPELFAGLAGSTPGGLPLDKLVHVALFALLGRSWLIAGAPGGGGREIALALAAIGYGGLLELLQGLGGVRAAEPLDLGADAFGVALAVVLRRWSRRNHAAGTGAGRSSAR